MFVNFTESGIYPLGKTAVYEFSRYDGIIDHLHRQTFDEVVACQDSSSWVADTILFEYGLLMNKNLITQANSTLV